MTDHDPNAASAEARARKLDAIRATHRALVDANDAILTRAADKLLGPDATPRSFERFKAASAPVAGGRDEQR